MHSAGSLKRAGLDQDGSAVVVHVYDVPGFKEHNDSIFGWFRFGVFHVEVELYGTNYAFVSDVLPELQLWTPGVILSVPAPQCVLRGASWRWTGIVGATEWTLSEVAIEIEKMRLQWTEYNIFHANCQDFASDFVSRASGGDASLPSWVRNAAQNLAKGFTPSRASHDAGESLSHANADAQFEDAWDMEPEIVRALAECKLQLLELLDENVPSRDSRSHALALLIQLVRWGEGSPPIGALDIPDCLLRPFVESVSCIEEPETLSIDLVDHLPALLEAAACPDSEGISPRARLAWAALAIFSKCRIVSADSFSKYPPPHLAYSGDCAVVAWRAIAWPKLYSQTSMFPPPP